MNHHKISSAEDSQDAPGLEASLKATDDLRDANTEDVDLHGANLTAICTVVDPPGQCNWYRLLYTY